MIGHTRLTYHSIFIWRRQSLICILFRYVIRMCHLFFGQIKAMKISTQKIPNLHGVANSPYITMGTTLSETIPDDYLDLFQFGSN